MKYVIDACNLIFQDDQLHETLEQRGFVPVKDMLVRICSKFAHNEGIEEVVLVFDGSEKAAHRPRMQSEAAGKVRLVFADPRTDADRFIIEMVEDAKRPGEITVISSDKFIIRHVQRASGKQISSAGFLRKIRSAARRAADPLKGEDPRKYNGISPREVEEWMKIFGFKDDE